jgi:hypothetical protein
LINYLINGHPEGGNGKLRMIYQPSKSLGYLRAPGGDEKMNPLVRLLKLKENP